MQSGCSVPGMVYAKNNTFSLLPFFAFSPTPRRPSVFRCLAYADVISAFRGKFAEESINYVVLLSARASSPLSGAAARRPRLGITRTHCNRLIATDRQAADHPGLVRRAIFSLDKWSPRRSPAVKTERNGVPAVKITLGRALRVGGVGSPAAGGLCRLRRVPSRLSRAPATR